MAAIPGGKNATRTTPRHLQASSRGCVTVHRDCQSLLQPDEILARPQFLRVMFQVFEIQPHFRHVSAYGDHTRVSLSFQRFIYFSEY